jgi:mono/diheme cytochrome c family protein
MKRFICIAAVALAAASVGARTSAIAQAQDAVQGDAAAGKQVYLAKGCFTCHGRSGQGGGYTGPVPALARTALAFDGFKALIRDPANNMPAYSDAVLSDKDIADIYAFLKAFPEPKAPNDVSILNN